MPLPDFLLIGAPKAGTTAVHVALAGHPRLFLSGVKEPKFFLTDGSPPPCGGGPGDEETFRRYVWRRRDYEALFDGAPPGALRGESTTLYLRDQAAQRRISALVPAARLIAILRDPVDRAHSNWTHLRSAGLEPERDFLRACALEEHRARRGWGPFWRYLELGRYGEHLTHLYTLFPREQVLVLLYRDVRQRPRETLDRVCTFLGVDTGVVTDIPAQNVTAAASPSALNDVLGRLLRAAAAAAGHVPDPTRRAVTGPVQRLLQREQRPRAPLTAAERSALIPAFADDIAHLEALTGLSLDHWRDPRNGVGRRPLTMRGRFGTAHGSIDRPLSP
jgi:hypothetical protein